MRSAAQTTPTAYAPAIQRTWPAVATTIASAPTAVRSMRRDGVPKRGWSARIDPGQHVVFRQPREHVLRSGGRALHGEGQKQDRRDRHGSRDQ